MKAYGYCQLYPFLRIAVCLASGIAVGYVLRDYLAPSMVYAAFFVTLLAGFITMRHPTVQSILLMGAVGTGGASLLMLHAEQLHLKSSDTETVYRAVLLNRPTARGKVVRCDIRMIDGEYAGKTIRATILRDTLTGRHSHLDTGDGILAYSSVQPLTDDTRRFNYALYLRTQHIAGTTFIHHNAWKEVTADLSTLTSAERTRLRLLRWRDRLKEEYRLKGFDENEYAIISAMTLGDKTTLTPDLKDTFAAGGASHLLALSGLHLGILYGLLALLVPKRRHPYLSGLLLMATIWGYTMLVGMMPSVVRAAIMLSIYAFVELLGRKKLSLNTLGLAATIMLTVHPFGFFDIGFQLSFMAVFGIALCHDSLLRVIPRRWQTKIAVPVWSIVSVSLAAQISVMPLVIYHFGSFPTYFLLTNLVAVPLATVILYLSVAVWGLSFSSSLQTIVVSALSGFAHTLNEFLKWVAALPGANLQGLSINLPQLAAIYVGFAFMFALLHRLFPRHFDPILTRSHESPNRYCSMTGKEPASGRKLSGSMEYEDKK